MPDLSTPSVVPWESDPTAQVILPTLVNTKGDPVSSTPRNVLKKVVELYIDIAAGKRVVAPEIEFYLVAQSDDPDYSAAAAQGPVGTHDHRRPVLFDRRLSTSSTSWSIDIYDFSDKQGLEIDDADPLRKARHSWRSTLRHGDPIELADQVFPVQAHHPARRRSSTACTPPSWPSRCEQYAWLGDAYSPVGG